MRIQPDGSSAIFYDLTELLPDTDRRSMYRDLFISLNSLFPFLLEHGKFSFASDTREKNLNLFAEHIVEFQKLYKKLFKRWSPKVHMFTHALEFAIQYGMLAEVNESEIERNHGENKRLRKKFISIGGISNVPESILQRHLFLKCPSSLGVIASGRLEQNRNRCLYCNKIYAEASKVESSLHCTCLVEAHKRQKPGPKPHL